MCWNATRRLEDCATCNADLALSHALRQCCSALRRVQDIRCGVVRGRVASTVFLNTTETGLTVDHVKNPHAGKGFSGRRVCRHWEPSVSLAQIRCPRMPTTPRPENRTISILATGNAFQAHFFTMRPSPVFRTSSRVLSSRWSQETRERRLAHLRPLLKSLCRCDLPLQWLCT